MNVFIKKCNFFKNSRRSIASILTLCIFFGIAGTYVYAAAMPEETTADKRAHNRCGDTAQLTRRRFKVLSLAPAASCRPQILGGDSNNPNLITRRWGSDFFLLDELITMTTKIGYLNTKIY